MRSLKLSRITSAAASLNRNRYICCDGSPGNGQVYPMLGFKLFENASVTIGGIELAQKIRKGQFDSSAINQQGLRAQKVWEAVLAA
jgi:IS6 family transposase